MTKTAVNARLCAIFGITTVIIGLSYWAGIAFFGHQQALIAAAGLVALFGMIFAIGRKKTAICMAYIAVVSVAIGLSISGFFSWLAIKATPIFALLLGVMLAYKLVQAAIHSYAGRKSRLFVVLCLVAEVATAITVAVLSGKNPSLCWQMFFVIIVSFFYSCTLLTIKSDRKGGIWHSAAVSYLLGFVFIFLLIILIAISIAAEDGSPLEILFEGLTPDVQRKKKAQ